MFNFFGKLFKMLTRSVNILDTYGAAAEAAAIRQSKLWELEGTQEFDERMKELTK